MATDGARTFQARPIGTLGLDKKRDAVRIDRLCNAPVETESYGQGRLAMCLAQGSERRAL